MFGDGNTPVPFITSWLQNLDVMWEEPALARFLNRLAHFGRVVVFDKRGTCVSDPVPLHTRPDPGHQPLRGASPSPRVRRYLAEHIQDAKYVELPGADTYPFQAGDFDQVLDEVEQFLTGVRPAPTVDRVLGTIVFTDIVASTQTAAAIGDAASLALRQTHDDLVRENLRRFRGREIDHTGDGFLALFDGPARAVTCAERIVEQVRELGIETRVECTPGRSSSSATRSAVSQFTWQTGSWPKPARG